MSWYTEDERVRRREEELAREEFGEDFSPLSTCNHRSFEEMLPEEEHDRYFTWIVCDKKWDTLVWAEERFTMLDVMGMFAYMRTDLYIGLEPSPDP